MVHSVNAALRLMQFVHKIAPATSQAAEDLAVKAGFMHGPDPGNVPGAAACGIHIRNDHLNIFLVHVCMISPCTDIR